MRKCVSQPQKKKKKKKKLADNKVNSRISKQVLQENKAHEIFRKTDISYPLIRGWEMFVFRKIWRALFSCNTRFEIRPFALLPTNCSTAIYLTLKIQNIYAKVILIFQC